MILEFLIFLSTANKSGLWVSITFSVWILKSFMVCAHTNYPSLQSYTSWFSFQWTILPRLWCLMLCPFIESLLHPLTWSIFSSALYDDFSCLLSIFDFTKFVLILWFSATIGLSISHVKSPIWRQVQLCSLLTYLVSLKYCPDKTLLSQFFKLLYFLFVFTIVVASRPCILSHLAPCFSLSSVSWMYTFCQFVISNSSLLFSRDIQSIYIGLWMDLPWTVNNFLVFLSISCNSLSLLPVNSGEYRNSAE